MKACPHCGFTDNIDGDRECFNCGEIMGNAPAAPARPEPVPAPPAPVPAPVPGPLTNPPFLLCTAGFAAGSKWMLARPNQLVGRDELEADVCIKDDALLSRKHLRLVQAEGKWYAEALSTTNPTYVGNLELKPGDRQELTDGVRIRCARTDLEFRMKEVV